MSRQWRQARRDERERADQERKHSHGAERARIAQQEQEQVARGRAEEAARAKRRIELDRQAAKVRAEDRARLDKEIAERRSTKEAARRYAESRNRAPLDRLLDGRAQRLRERVAPTGTPIEQALDAVLPPEGQPADGIHGTLNETLYDESFRPLALRLARKFMRPDEQILAAVEAQVRVLSPHPPTSLKAPTSRLAKITVVVFTHGFAVKTKGREFRSDAMPDIAPLTEPTGDQANDEMRRRLDAIMWGHPVDPNPDGLGHIDVATVTLGDLTIEARSGASLLFTPLREQAVIRSRPTPKAAPAKIRKTVKAAAARPAPRLIRTARDAELVAAEWMTHLGFTHVTTTPVGADGGIDVTSDEAVAQVKAESIPTGRPKIQQHHGVAVSHSKTAIFFSLAGYTPQARTYAEANGIVLFTFDLQGQPEPVNPAAYTLISKGL
ncbi:restriction endonuclease [Rothia sp. ARF10]|nr:restriction endonuclease [Rothia sp. ARF10]